MTSYAKNGNAARPTYHSNGADKVTRKPRSAPTAAITAEANNITAAEIADMRGVLAEAPVGGYSAKTVLKFYGRTEPRINSVLRHMLEKQLVTLRSGHGGIEMWELVR